MRHAAGELADGLHLLRLAQLLLCALAGGDLLHQVGGALLDALLQRRRELGQRGALGRQLVQQRIALDIGGLSRGNVDANADQRPRLAIGMTDNAGASLDPVHRAIRPDVAIFDVVVGAILQGSVQRLLATFAIIGINRSLQVVEGERLRRAAPEEGLAGIRQLQLHTRQMQFQRTEAPGIERGLQQPFALAQVLENGAGLILPAPAAHGGADHRDQRRRVKRSLDEGDVSE